MKRVGTLLPMTALVSTTVPSGTFGVGEQFVEWLAATKQTAWQILPLHQTQLQKGSKSKHVPSPYKGYGIGLDPQYLCDDAEIPTDEQINTFIKSNKYWVSTYTLFCALRDHFGTDDWSKWPTEIRKREKRALTKWQKKLAPEISGHLVLQVQLHLAYEQLHKTAKINNILLIGDMPFYLGLHSPLVWEYQHLFEIELSGKLSMVSGVLKGIKSHFGRQVWGHPLYRWQDKECLSGIYKIFRIRFKYLTSFYNLVRFDYANGLFVYGVIDLKDHAFDRYQIGPGRPFLERLIRSARSLHLKIYAEDTGINLKELRNCLHAHRVPGLKIFRFAYNEKRKIFVDMYLRISRYPVNTVAYTTTHDTEPLLGYLEKLSAAEIDALRNKLRIKKSINIRNLAISIREKVIKSPAKIVLVPLQDWLLTTDRINVPGTEKEVGDTNWQYKMTVAIEDLPIQLF